ncbi:Sperm-tail PG-rich repeat-containing protein 2, partial [Coelomomyces lativittatus]
NSSAPFLQKSPRVCYFDELAKNSGPAAPGSFDISDSDTAHRVVKAVPFAASQSPRFAQTPSTTPGPGSYTTSNVDGKFINSADKDRKSHKFNDTKKKKIVWKRKFMPPSIPYGAQAYGYEETEDGQLVLRRSGHKAESDPKERLANHGDFLRANAGTYFGKSTSRRYVWEDNGNPAPGMYNISKPWNISTIKNFRQINSQTCVRFGEYVIADALRKAIPGPGTYNAQAHPSSESPKCVPFGKSPARTSKPPVTPFAYNSQPSDTLTPGPCSYDVAKATLSKKPMHVSRKPFDSSGYRFSSIVQTCAPGPGKYEIASQIVKEENRTPTSAFGSVSERFMPPTRVDTPGPAEYQKPTEKKKKKNYWAYFFTLPRFT